MSVPEIARRWIGGRWQTGVAEDATGGGLPAGGSTGEVLTKESNADGDVGWEPSGGAQTDVGVAPPGAWIPCMGYRGIATAGTQFPAFGSTTTPGEMGAASGTDVFVPWYLPGAVTVGTLGWKIYTGGGVVGLYRIGLYSADVDWQPDALLWDSGQQDASDETLQTDTPALTLPAGRYLQAFCADDDAISNAYTLAAMALPPFVDTGTPSTDLETGATGPGAFFRARTFGAFPDPGNPWTTTTDFDTLSSVCWPLYAVLS